MPPALHASSPVQLARRPNSAASIYEVGVGRCGISARDALAYALLHLREGQTTVAAEVPDI